MTPAPIHTSLNNDSSFATATRPIIITTKKMVGPTTASNVLTAIAFFTSLSDNMTIAAHNSMAADKKRKLAIVQTVASIFIASSLYNGASTTYAETSEFRSIERKNSSGNVFVDKKDKSYNNSVKRHN